jgi:hypothetical protein
MNDLELKKLRDGFQLELDKAKEKMEKCSEAISIIYGLSVLGEKQRQDWLLSNQKIASDILRLRVQGQVLTIYKTSDSLPELIPVIPPWNNE